ncbi:MAG: HD domain-containing protein [Hyphomicrobiales bacterium]
MRDRIRQFRDAGRPPTVDDYAIAAPYLDGPLLELFRAQHPRDIVHSAATARWLLDRGYDDPDLIAAALLHDIGKGHQRRFDRVAYVVAGKLRVASLLGSPGSRFEVRRAIARSLAHSERGVALLRAAGASERVVDLTARHHRPPGDDRVLALLQQADAAS